MLLLIHAWRIFCVFFTADNVLDIHTGVHQQRKQIILFKDTLTTVKHQAWRRVLCLNCFSTTGSFFSLDMKQKVFLLAGTSQSKTCISYCSPAQHRLRSKEWCLLKSVLLYAGVVVVAVWGTAQLPDKSWLRFWSWWTDFGCHRKGTKIVRKEDKEGWLPKCRSWTEKRLQLIPCLTRQTRPIKRDNSRVTLCQHFHRTLTAILDPS